MQLLATAPGDALISRILDQRVLEAVVGLRWRALDKQEVSFGKPIQRRLQRALVEASHGSEQRIRETAAQHRADLRGLARRAEPIEPCRERLLQGRRDRLRAALFATSNRRRVTSSTNSGTPPVRSLTPSTMSRGSA